MRLDRSLASSRPTTGNGDSYVGRCDGNCPPSVVRVALREACSDPVSLTESACSFLDTANFISLAKVKSPNDLATFINEVGSIVQGCLDSLGFHLVTPLRAEIMSMIADGNRLIHRTVDWPELLPEPSTRHVAADKLQPFIAAAMDEPLARLALANLWAAIESPDDTGYLAYRAVESVRQWFLVGEEDDGSAREQSWRGHACGTRH